jgi:hypothetical protein
VQLSDFYIDRFPWALSKSFFPQNNISYTLNNEPMLLTLLVSLQ